MVKESKPSGLLVGEIAEVLRTAFRAAAWGGSQQSIKGVVAVG
jgi:hypothetical protein